jgi:hypothetical protein
MLVRKIMAIYPSLTKEDFGRSGTIHLLDNGGGPYIAKWEHPTLAQPTQEQLDAIVIDMEALIQRDAMNVADAAAVKADAFVQSFIAMTNSQVSNYVNANTNNITEVRALLNKMALMLLALARREYR